MDNTKEYYFKEIDSTQDYARKLYLDGKSNFVVYADKQTLGRGRNGRKWEAPCGGLWFSFDVDFHDTNSLFTMSVGIAAREVLADVYGYRVELKWPNDLILDRKKVGGIICEKVGERVIVGIGINTNVKNLKEEKATIFLEKTGKCIDNYELMNLIINKCKEVIKLKNDTVVENFRKNMAYKGELCFVSAINENAKIIDLADNGSLIVETNGGLKEVFAGEINVCM